MYYGINVIDNSLLITVMESIVLITQNYSQVLKKLNIEEIKHQFLIGNNRGY